MLTHAERSRLHQRGLTVTVERGDGTCTVCENGKRRVMDAAELHAMARPHLASRIHEWLQEKRT